MCKHKKFKWLTNHIDCTPGPAVLFITKNKCLDIYKWCADCGALFTDNGNPDNRKWIVPKNLSNENLSEEDLRQKVLEKMNTMSSQEVLKIAIKAGIYDENGNLTPKYGGTKP